MTPIALLGESALAQWQIQIESVVKQWQQQWCVTPAALHISCRSALQRGLHNQHRHPAKNWQWQQLPTNWRALLWGDEANKIPDDDVAQRVIAKAQDALQQQLSSLAANHIDDANLSYHALIDVTVACGSDHFVFAFLPPPPPLAKSSGTLKARQDVLGAVTSRADVVLPLGDISLAQVQQLRPGHVIQTDVPLSALFTVCSEQHKTLFHAQLGQQQNHRAVVLIK